MTAAFDLLALAALVWAGLFATVSAVAHRPHRRLQAQPARVAR